MYSRRPQTGGGSAIVWIILAAVAAGFVSPVLSIPLVIAGVVFIVVRALKAAVNAQNQQGTYPGQGGQTLPPGYQPEAPRHLPSLPQQWSRRYYNAAWTGDKHQFWLQGKDPWDLPPEPDPWDFK